MTEIRFEDVRVGDRVRWTVDEPALCIVAEGEVTKAGRGGDRPGGGYVVNFDDKGTFELLHRPVPPAVCGDIREDPRDGARYVRTGTDDPGRRHWIAFTGHDLGRSLYADGDAEIIARLRPVTS